jgi:hypothetical protein
LRHKIHFKLFQNSDKLSFLLCYFAVNFHNLKLIDRGRYRRPSGPCGRLSDLYHLSLVFIGTLETAAAAFLRGWQPA